MDEKKEFTEPAENWFWPAIVKPPKDEDDEEGEEEEEEEVDLFIA